MRPTVYGLQKVCDRNGIFVGVNLGYNFYCEHEGGTQSFIDNVNRDNSMLIKSLISQGKGNLYINRQLKKIHKEDEKKLRLTANTPFLGSVIKSSAYAYTRTITVSNKDILSKYSRFLLQDGKYDLFLLSHGYYLNCYVDKFRNRKVMNEEEIFYMPDYNRGLLGTLVHSQLDFAGAWADDGILILFKHDDNKPNLAEDLADSIKRGYLAIVPQEPQMFKERGCCLIELDRAYFGRR